MISVLSPAQAVEKISHSVFLTAQGENKQLSDELLAQVLRRTVQIMAPCAAHELKHAVLQSLPDMTCENEPLQDKIDRLTEELIVYGDILEMHGRSEDDRGSGRRFILRPAPPSFVERQNGSIAILGVAGDQLSALTGELEARVKYHGVLRTISPLENESLQSLLVDLGLLRLPERTWLRLPTIETPSAHVANWRRELLKEPPSATLDGLEILDTARPPTFYKDRWCVANSKHDGLFVARRPQRYGAALWCLAEFEQGSLRRFKDLSSAGDRLRPFDLAWRIQAAFDALANNPQRFDRTEKDTSTSVLRFYSPLPSWAERHLSISGIKKKTDRCLFSFEIPTSQTDSETKFLSEILWMTERARQTA